MTRRDIRKGSSADEYLPGYEARSDVEIHVLGPILEQAKPTVRGLRELDNASVTRNGHSIVLRVVYGHARILLTGDLNTTSQRLLLSYHDLGESLSTSRKAVIMDPTTSICGSCVR